MSLRYATQGKWVSILQRLGVPSTVLSGKHQKCPVCKQGKDCFRFTDKDQQGKYICERCGSGNGYDLVQAFNQCDFPQALRLVSGVADGALIMPSREVSSDWLKTQIAEVGRGLQPVTEGDPVHTYLASRCLTPNEFLRYHPNLKLFTDRKLVGEFPAMVAVLQRPDGRRVGYHRTFLLPEGKERRVLGKSKGTVIPLCEAGEVLGIAEGIESALSVTELLGVPCWAAYCANNLKSFNPPENVKRVRVFADTDQHFAGQLAAVELCHNLTQQGIQAELQPFLSKGDWNDKLQMMRRYRRGTAA